MDLKMQVMNFSSANCKNCYKCVRTCTVKAIDVLNDQAKINEYRCISCGHCLVVCPQNARHVLSDIEKVKNAIAENKTVIAALAPSFRGVFEKPGSFVTALKNIGISSIEEISIGAEMVSCEYEKIIKNSSSSKFITSCCPSIVMLIEKYYPELIPYLLPVDSPMIAHGKSIKARNKDAFVVFIGPCISKKCEVLLDENAGIIDAVLTFDEVMEFLRENNINYNDLPESEVDYSGSTRGDKYPTVGGILSGLRDSITSKNLDVIQMHGLSNCETMLKDLMGNNVDNVCIEMSACNESCLGGPGAANDCESPFVRLKRIHNHLRCSKIKTIDTSSCSIDLSRKFNDRRVLVKKPSEEELKAILRNMGKYTKEQELNCGACGYNSCIEKATAVYNGMSQVEMCVPYMRSLTESVNAEIFKNSPNALIFLNEDLTIKDINPSGIRIFLNDSSNDVIGNSIYDLIHDDDFNPADGQLKEVSAQKIYYSWLGFHGYKSITHIKDHSSYIVAYTDITEEEKRKEDVIEMKRKAIDVTQTIVNKQMRVAQEIASLLGETTAETKVAILDLKKVLEKD